LRWNPIKAFCESNWGTLDDWLYRQFWRGMKQLNFEHPDWFWIRKL
jgi:hypothetical protein